MHPHVAYATRGASAIITVNRPAVRNALNVAALEDLRLAFDQAAGDPSVRVVILTGAGDKAFAAGADISEIAGLSLAAGAEFSRRGQAVFDRIEGLGKPTIAAVNGYALGGGCELALACMIRIAAENAVFGQPEVKLGLIPGYGGTIRLPRLIGSSRALEAMLSGEVIPAAEALRIGLVSRVVPQAALMETAEALAAKIAANAPLAVKACIQSVARGDAAVEAALFGDCCGTEDMKEGTQAFLSKRTPEFRGR